MKKLGGGAGGALDVVEKRSTPNSNGINNFDHRYSNINLNENYKCSNISSLVQSDSKSKKHDKTFVFTDNFEKRKNLQSKIVEHCSKNFSKYDEAEEKVKNRWKKESSSATSSTLFLHIAENSVESFTNALDKNERFKKKGLVEKWKNVKQIFAESLQSLIQNPFEFPRQKKEGQVDDPEVMQFKASQQLLNPNQSTSSTSFPHSSQDMASEEEQQKADQTLAQQLAESEQAMYEQSQQQIQEIEDEVRQTQALVGGKETIEAGLISAYDQATSPEYYQKALELSNRYSHIRKIRGDGNCFYRAVLTAVIERVLHNRDELEPLNVLCKGWRKRLMDQNFPELTTGDFCDAMETLLESIKENLKTNEVLMDDLNQDGIANYYVAFLRLITSGYLRENEAEYAGFIEGGRTLDQYCIDEIEPMWKDCDHLSIIALVNALKTSLRIEYMDRSQAPSGGWHHDFCADDSEPKLYMLFRPGHYDLLYKKNQQ